MEPNYDSIKLVGIVAVGGAILAALLYPLVNRYGLLGISPKKEEY